jgi:hypothetical protein
MVDPWWVTGLVDGEGFFSARVNRSGENKKRPSFVLRFGVLLRADDVEVLEKLKGYFGAGRIQRHKPRVGKKGLRLNPQSELRIGPPDILTCVIPHFERFPLQSKKATDYAVWAEIAHAVHELGARDKHWRRDPSLFAHVEGMCDKLFAGRKFSAPQVGPIAAE